MAASFPTSVKSFSAITPGVTTLEQSLFDDTVAEVEAIETALGVNCHGSSGSIAERINLSLNADGYPPGHVAHVQSAVSVGVGRRVRCGVDSFAADDLTSVTIGGLTLAGTGTISFIPQFPTGGSEPIVFFELQLTESDPSLDTIAAFVCQYGTPTQTSASFLVSTRKCRKPASGTSFILHWIAMDDASYNASDGF